MKIYDQEINPGEKCTVKIPVANLPSGTEIDLYTHVFRSKKEGPVLLIIGGLHGDEVNGVEIVRRAVSNKLFNKLKCGSVIAVPLLNVYGFINFSRGLPDGKDANRSFPGTRSGSLASRVAYTFSNEILPHATMALDFHTGGNSVYNYPQIRYSDGHQKSVDLANATYMPFSIKSSLIPRSLRKTAIKKDIPLVVFEGGESLRIDEFSVLEGLRGIENVLVANGMISGKVKKKKQIHIVDKDWVRATRSGVVILEHKSGDFVEKGAVLAQITDPYNTYQSKVIAKRAGHIFGHNNNPLINKGDALFHIGYTDKA